jgi:hypothetical protein
MCVYVSCRVIISINPSSSSSSAFDSKLDVLGTLQCEYEGDRPNKHTTLVGWTATGAAGTFVQTFGCGGALDHARSVLALADFDGDGVLNALLSTDSGLQLYELGADVPRQIVARAFVPLYDADRTTLLDVDGDGAHELLFGADLLRFACDASVFTCHGGRRCDSASGACVLAECHAASTPAQCQASTCFVTGQPCRFDAGRCDCDAAFTGGRTTLVGASMMPSDDVSQATPASSVAGRQRVAAVLPLLLLNAMYLYV